MFYLNSVLLAAGGQQGGGMVQLVMMGAIILVFWLFMIRPQAKKAKEQKEVCREYAERRQNCYHCRYSWCDQ